MTINDFIPTATQLLAKAGISTARLDALVLLEDALGKDRSYILAHGEETIPETIAAQLDTQLQRRALHEPLAYIRRKTEFYGRDFVVTNSVLEPRPESETMIDLLKKMTLPPDTQLADIGSGSGALGITAALELGTKKADFYDIDPATLEVAKQNAQTHGVRGTFVQSNLLEQSRQPYDVLLCNLPYVPDSFQINTAAGHEPRVAIFGGFDGLDLYRTLFMQLADLAWKPSYIFAESLPTQHKALAHMARHYSFALIDTDDFIQVFEPMSPAGQYLVSPEV